MILLTFSILLGLLLYIVTLFLLKKLNKLQNIHPLLGVGAIYFIFFYLWDKIATLFPETWRVKQFNTPVQIDNAFGMMLHLDEPKMTAIEITYGVLLVCIIGQFILTFMKLKTK